MYACSYCVSDQRNSPTSGHVRDGSDHHQKRLAQSQHKPRGNIKLTYNQTFAWNASSYRYRISVLDYFFLKSIRSFAPCRVSIQRHKPAQCIWKKLLNGFNDYEAKMELILLDNTMILKIYSTAIKMTLRSEYGKNSDSFAMKSVLQKTANVVETNWLSSLAERVTSKT